MLPRPAHRRRRLAAVLLAAGLIAGGWGSAPADAAPRLDLKVLVVAATGTESGLASWRAALDREGVPYDVIVADSPDGTITDERLADYANARARYQAVILASGDLAHPVTLPDGTTSYPTALTDAEWAALAKLERTFGIRRISDSTVPSPAHGLNWAVSAGDQGGSTGTLTAAGGAAFPELRGTVPIDGGSWGYRSTPVSTTTFTTLLTGPGDAAYLGVYRNPADGREELVKTVDGNPAQSQEQLLRHGMLRWVTRGVYLGYQRNWFSMHIDDVFLPDDRWNSDLNLTAVDGPTTAPDEIQCDNDAASPAPDCRPIRMTPADVTRAVTWQNANGMTLDFAFNGAGSDEAGAGDPLTAALLAQRARFRWVNHTYSHANLDAVSLNTLTQEIRANITWARNHGLPIDATELVTGEHSGLHNPFMPSALSTTGIRWIAADNSREPAQYAIGPARTVPRYPSNVYYNVGTRAEQLDEYNHIYLPPSLGGRCVASPVNTCRTAPATWDQYVASEAGIMFGHVTANDPRPHYAHQSNLAEDGVLYPVMDAVLARYRASFTPPLLQASTAASGALIAQRAAWSANRSRVTAYLTAGKVHLTSSATVEVPLTGTSVGDAYGGDRSGWTTVRAGTAKSVNVTATGAPTGAPATPPAPAPTPSPRNGLVATILAPVVRIVRLVLRPRRFAVTRSARSRAGRAADGTTVRWTVVNAARIKLRLQRRVGGPGRRHWIGVATYVRRTRTAHGALRLRGVVKGRRLPPGRYRVLAMALDRGGRASARRSATFTIERRR